MGGTDRSSPAEFQHSAVVIGSAFIFLQIKEYEKCGIF